MHQQGHLKTDHRMNRCHLRGGGVGDAVHAVLCAAGYNIRWLLRMIVKKGLCFFMQPAASDWIDRICACVASNVEIKRPQIQCNALG